MKSDGLACGCVIGTLGCLVRLCAEAERLSEAVDEVAPQTEERYRRAVAYVEHFSGPKAEGE